MDSVSVKVVLDGDDDAPKLWDFSRFHIAIIGNNVTHDRLTKTINDLEKSNHSLLGYMFDDSTGRYPALNSDLFDLGKSVSARLNPPQQRAVQHCMTNSLVTLIQGPPGTGKTTTLAAFIAECVRVYPQVKILACAPSNVAVDNLAFRVLGLGVKTVVRVGHPTRVSEDMLAHCLDALVNNSDFASSCVEIRREIQSILDSRKGYSALRELRKELKQREAKSIEQVFKQSNVVFTTCNGAFNIDRKLGIKVPSSEPLFDICVIDECAQALEMSCWIPILQSRRAVLGGDHQQLSATIHSKEAERRGLGTTLFERCFKRFQGSTDGITNVLTIQYRMHRDIMGWSNQQFYNNVLEAHASVADMTLDTGSMSVMLHGVDMSSIITSPVVFCDTCGVEGMSEDVSDNKSASKSNQGEISVIEKYVELIHCPEIADDICIIAPYLKQAELLRNSLRAKHPSIDISTVDSFQGREGDVVIISLVRSNPDHVVGFLSDYRRLNVAITRAKRHVFVVGDSETISSDPILQTLYDYACDHGMVISAQSFVDNC
jgi:ATP-dependent RNA/DNA helicase IGHMBP2